MYSWLYHVLEEVNNIILLYLPVTESQFFQDFSLKVDHVLKQLPTLLSSLTRTEGKELNFAELVDAIKASSGSSCPSCLGTETVTKGNMSEEREKMEEEEEEGGGVRARVCV